MEFQYWYRGKCNCFMSLSSWLDSLSLSLCKKTLLKLSVKCCQLKYSYIVNQFHELSMESQPSLLASVENFISLYCREKWGVATLYRANRHMKALDLTNVNLNNAKLILGQFMLEEIDGISNVFLYFGMFKTTIP